MENPIFNFKNGYINLPDIFFSKLKPTPVAAPETLLWNLELAQKLNLNTESLDSKKMANIFSGNTLAKDSQPLAQAYSGHQFGHFTHLGDGRAHLLGEHQDLKGQLWDIQLKGSGPTPYSRRGDGRASLGSMLREYIISEAMHALGIPTTRSLAVVTTGEPVYRQDVLPGAILTRVAKSHLRVGTFQFAHTQRDTEALKLLFGYSVERLAPHCIESESPALTFLSWVQDQQAHLVAQWLLVGFIHGVMNTDNMALSGETIDYGPCAFMDIYKANTVYSSIDRQGRYSYSNQAPIAHWNLTRFAETLLPLIDTNPENAAEKAAEKLSEFPEKLHKNWLTGMCHKLGWLSVRSGDDKLIGQWLQLLEKHEQDYTNSFFSLSQERKINADFFNQEDVKSWQQKRKQRLEAENLKEGESAKIMLQNNPAVIPRNHRVEQALKQAEDLQDMSLVHKLLEVLKTPYQVKPEHQEYQRLPSPQERVYKTFCGT